MWGDVVEARFQGKTTYHTGKVVGVWPNGTYSISYDDGNKEDGIKAEMIRPFVNNVRRRRSPVPNSGRAKRKRRVKRKQHVPVISIPELPAAKVGNTDCPSPEKKFKPTRKFLWGDIVEARFQGKTTYHTGKVVGVWPNGTYSISYDDGSREDGIRGELIRPFERRSRRRRSAVSGAGGAQSTRSAATGKHEEDAVVISDSETAASSSSKAIEPSHHIARVVVRSLHMIEAIFPLFH